EGLTPPEKEEYLQITLRSVFVEPGVRDDPPPLFLTRELRDRMQQEGEIDPGDFPDEMPLEAVQRTSDVYYRKPPRKVIDVLADEHNPLAVILGDPGSGKSTLTRYIVLSLIDPAGDPRLRSACADYLPVLVELRSYVALRRQHPDWKGFTEYLAHLGATEGFFPDQATLERYLADDGRALVIFDGLDEVFDPEERLQVSRQILFFATTYPRARVIVTSRIIGYSRKVLDEGGFRHFTLQDLDIPQVEQFVTRWYNIALSDKPDEAERRRERIMDAYQHSASVRQLAGNPMLLTIMAIIGKHQDLPRDRGDLYAHAATVLIEHWDVNKYLSKHTGSGTGIYLNPEPSHYSAIDAEDKREMLRRLAFRMQGGKGGLAGNYIHHDELQGEFAGYLKERYDWTPHVAKTVASLMLLQFRERNFILSLYGAKLYGFVHRAFLEYFCATAFRNQFERKQVLSFNRLKSEVFGEHWRDPSWHEVLRLVSGMLDPEFTAQIIRYLTEDVEAKPATATGDDFKPWNVALAVQCLAEARNLQPMAGTAERVLRRVCEVFDADMQRPPRLFAFMRDQIVPYARSMGASWPHSELLAEILRGREAHRFAYIYDHTFGTFIGALGRGSPEVRGEVLRYAQHERHEHRVLAPFALACGWHDDPEVLSLLRSLADQDGHMTVRYAALYALAEHYTHEKGTLRMLRTHAAEGPSSFERAAALEGLSKHFGDDRQVYRIVRHQSLTDEDKYPRTVAIKALGEFFRHEPLTYSTLLLKARTDPSPEPGERKYTDAYYCREAAVEALARHWPLMRETVECLRGVAQADPVDWMRELAAARLENLQRAQ
ncbi:MAG TPA: HEAT repeat domain-containing protein, partial [Longimicrobium sp.]|nr:HEAT repeat domain-containing protein [Longimicrobium sp.]